MITSWGILSHIWLLFFSYVGSKFFVADNHFAEYIVWFACTPNIYVVLLCYGHISSFRGLVWFNHTCYLGSSHWHCNDRTNALVPVKPPSRIWLKIAKTKHNRMHIDNLVQDCSNSSGLAMELLQFCTKLQDIPHHAVQAKAHITSGFACQFQIDGNFMSSKCW